MLDTRLFEIRRDPALRNPWKLSFNNTNSLRDCWDDNPNGCRGTVLRNRGRAPPTDFPAVVATALTAVVAQYFTVSGG